MCENGLFYPTSTTATKSDHFAKTGSRQTITMMLLTKKGKRRFSFGSVGWSTPNSFPTATCRWWRHSVSKTGPFAPFIYIKTNILPGQARDEHSENSKKGQPFFLRHGLQLAVPHFPYDLHAHVCENGATTSIYI